MSIRNFTKLFSKMVIRQPLQIPRQIPFRNFSTFKPNETKLSELNVKNQGNEDNIMLDQGGQLKGGLGQNENTKIATNTSETGNFEPSSARDSNLKEGRVEKKMTQRQKEEFEPVPNKSKSASLNPETMSELNFVAESPSATHEATTTELTLRAKQLQTTTKRDYHQCLELCEQHPEKNAEQIVDMINKSSSANKQTY